MKNLNEVTVTPIESISERIGIIPYKKLPKWQKQKAEKMFRILYDAGYSIKGIAMKLKAGETTVRNWKTKHYGKSIYELKQKTTLENITQTFKNKTVMKDQENIMELIKIEQGQPVTTSLKVAEVFNKQHKHVIEKIEQIEQDGGKDDFHRSNFRLNYYKDTLNRRKKIYEMTKDGFYMLVMGYNGKRALQFKKQYIKAFNQMAESLKLAYNQL